MQLQRLQPQQLYDAVVDDDLFASMPQLIAAAFEARSCVLHWRSNSGEAEILSHSGYFSDAQMQDYADNYTAHDVWTISGAQRSRVNRAWNVEEFVAPAEYERSLFYNEWIRGMGDDTFHCIGSVMETRWGYGCVGLHRGRTQKSFDAGRLSALSEDVLHLRRMLGFRGRLKDAIRQNDRLAGALNSLGNPILILDPSGRLLHANASGEELLRQEDGLRIRKGLLEASSLSANKQLRFAIDRAADAQNPVATAVAVPRASGAELNLSLVGTTAGGVHQVLVEIAAATGASPSVKQQVRELFGLSEAEAEVATSLASGKTLDEIAFDRGCAVATVRSQLKSVMQKMSCRKQSDVVRLICELPRLR